MLDYEELGMTNLFKGPLDNKEVNFRNRTGARDSVSSIEIRTLGKEGYCWETHEIVIDPEDNAAMALSLLGVGRVTDKLEEQAQRRAAQLVTMASSTSESDFIETAVINLRAAVIVREQREATFKKHLDDAYALYKLAYPNSNITRDEFVNDSMSGFWRANLRKIRQDPTVLGAL